MQIPFNRPHLTGNEFEYIAEAHANRKLAGDGLFTKKCNQWLENNTTCKKNIKTN